LPFLSGSHNFLPKNPDLVVADDDFFTLRAQAEVNGRNPSTSTAFVDPLLHILLLMIQLYYIRDPIFNGAKNKSRAYPLPGRAPDDPEICETSGPA
jgi:hypothetical protein